MEITGAEPCRGLARHIQKLSLAAICALGLSGCAAQTSGVANLTVSDCKKISDRAEARINWARVPEVELTIRDGEYSPMVTRLKQGRPYVLRIRNRDMATRVFRAGDLFAQNAVLAIGVEGVREPETCIASVTIPSKQTAEIRMVAITDGTFEYEDNRILLPWVFSAGPGGVIVIEERRETAGLN